MDSQVYDKEVKAKWGDTVAYSQCAKKHKSHSPAEIDGIHERLNSIFVEFGTIKHLPIDDATVQDKVKFLQDFITEHYYECTSDILLGLSQMYISDDRFQKNIDALGGEGTADFVSKAIALYCKKSS